MTKTLTFQGVDGLNKALRLVGPEASVELRNASQRIAGKVALDAINRAVGLGGVARLVAPTIKATRDRVPVVKMGGSKKLRTNGRPRSGPRQTVGDVIWGAEFGGQRRATTQQFDPWRGNDDGAGYFLWPAIRADQPVFIKEYDEALLTAVDKSAHKAGGH